MTPNLVVAVLTCVLVGLVCTIGLWTKHLPTVPMLVFMASLAVGLGFGLSACVSFLSLSLFGLVYLNTPYDLAWHMAFSAKRLLLQLWPSVAFLAFLAASPPERSSG